ncbi:histidine kinase dimerization/phosphoacceptor domain -containing protein [Pseudooceanicola aestuarii]|uniref:histidine kinase dimerization/phosphoacceptor domain -containing protein n=1 Tax=Pseudooceanicola aestuarii TaxID=2697319 RepID=UPI0013D48324|nr:histidine kinase dimerization/phosphoacceptor domain -containing protein [Pseudooceanicola aestuarii]
MRIGVLDRLGTRVVAMLTVALLPVGLIAIMQTRSVVTQADELARTALVGVTRALMEPQGDLTHEGFAAARVLAGALVPMLDDLEGCSALMSGFVRAHPNFTIATFVDAEGQSSCNSRNQVVDLSNSVTYQTMRDRPAPRIARIDTGRLSGSTVILISQPVFDANELIGHVSLSLPTENVRFDIDTETEQKPLEMVLINSQGETLMTASPNPEASDFLPAYRDLSTYHYRRATAFAADDRAGDERLYTIVPLIPGIVFGVVVWDLRDVHAETGLMNRSALAFPVLMWAISLIVSYFAVHRLVIRYVRILRDKMRYFGREGELLEAGTTTLRGMPSELRQMEETFNHMVERITRDTAELENNLHEKNVLLKEVHHRVKNNLQLIASIMNMEMRKASAQETKLTLRRVQDRILGLATVHSNLYQTSRLSSLRADALLEDIVNHTLRGSVGLDDAADVHVTLEEAVLAPDQAVPLSLLATEAATNAAKYLGQPETGKPWIRVELLRDGPRRFVFSIANSKGTRLQKDWDREESGLGSQLILAFASQLATTPEVTEDEETYTMRIAVSIPGSAENDNP